jgi:hypothetical protein
MHKIVALVTTGALVIATANIAASGEGKNTSQALAQTPTPPTGTQPLPCTPAKKLLKRKNWRDAHPLRGEDICEIGRRRLAKLKERFFLWRRYRSIAPYYLGENDPWLRWVATPAYIVRCETRGYYGRGRWRAANASGAVGPYQLLGWGAPYPADTPHEKVRNHEIAASLGLGNWACA